jgi:hypothetical protein
MEMLKSNENHIYIYIYIYIYMINEISTAGSEWFPEQSVKCKRGSGCLIAYACRPSPGLNFVLEEKNTRNHYNTKQVTYEFSMTLFYIRHNSIQFFL